jgi:hypothetical protein
MSFAGGSGRRKPKEIIMSTTAAVLRAAGAACNRVMDELPTILLGAIALCVLHLTGQATLVHDVVLSVVSGLLGYMKSPRNPTPKTSDASPPAPPAS